eukprot:TRINITY_DN40485_c0_g1_i1.p1 TRINITY_DN40485_c0_g1~~TRINITY_DN40485_c0_g1_i1.p1  ORF type:complete len:485 (+),score=118.81 TRINITY_DN40485_c0_g1_i1:66-1457(+)
MPRRPASAPVLHAGLTLVLLVQCILAVLCRRRVLGGSVAGRMALYLAVHSGTTLLFWAWALRHPLVAPERHAVVCSVHCLWAVYMVAPSLPRPPWLVWRGITAVAAWHSQLVWLSAPLLPFTFIWMVVTPLPILAPLCTHIGMKTALPAFLMAAAAVAVWQSGPPRGAVRRVVSMLHREAPFGLSGAALRRVAPPSGRRSGARYVDVAHISDLCLGALTRPEDVRELVRKAVLLQPDIAVLTGGYFAMEFVRTARSQAELSTALATALSGLAGMCERGRVFACLGAADVADPTAAAAAKAAFSGLGVTVLCGTTSSVQIGGGVGEVRIGGVGPDRAIPDVADAAAPGIGLFGRRRSADPLTLLLTHDADVVHAVPHSVHLVLAGGRLGGLIGLQSLGVGVSASRLVERVRKEPYPADGLWGRGYLRMFLSRGVGCGGVWPPFPPLRLGVPSELPVLSVEVPSH